MADPRSHPDQCRYLMTMTRADILKRMEVLRIHGRDAKGIERQSIEAEYAELQKRLSQ